MHSVFKSDSPHGNVVFNFLRSPVDDLAPFAHGYHNAGRRLVSILERASGYPDFDGYPILFLYRHALELYMKAIVYRGAKLLHLLEATSVNTSKLFTNHRLTPLLPGVKAVCDALQWTQEFSAPELASFDQFADIVRAIDELDAKAEIFRYPVDTSGREALSHHTVINVIGFAKRMDPILGLLAGAVTGLHEEFDAAAEAKYELQEVIKEISEQGAEGDAVNRAP